MQEKMKDTRHENMTMRALYLIAAVFVVDGHTTLADMFDMQSLFRYYSFHLMLFAFGSGYFFRDGDQRRLLSSLARKAKRLLVPLYLWNIVYGVGARSCAASAALSWASRCPCIRCSSPR